MNSSTWIKALGVGLGFGFGLGLAGPAAGATTVASSPNGPAEIDAAVRVAVSAALAAASSVPEARVEMIAIERPRTACAAGIPERVEVARTVDGSARVAVKLIGPSRGGAAPCEAWSWARFRLLARVPVAARAVRAGESLAGAMRLDEREIKVGHVPAEAAVLEGGAIADRALVAGQIIEADALRAAGPRPGEAVKVVVVAGSLAIEETGRAVPCARNHNCAVLPSGRHVDGTFVDGRLLVQMP